MPYMDSYTETPNMGSYLYNGPSQAVLEISNAVMSGGQILRIPSPAPNASWELDFFGPSLKCENVDASMHLRFQQNIAAGMNHSMAAYLYGYLGWFPTINWWDGELTNTVPFLADSQNGSLHFAMGESSGLASDTNITFYLTALPDIFGASTSDVVAAFNPPYEGSSSGIPKWVDGTMIQCVLYNSTYTVSFQYVEGIQTIVPHVNTNREAIPQGALLGPNPKNPGLNPCETSGTLSDDQKAECYNENETLRALSYSAIMDAFGTTLKGSVYVDGLQQLHRSSNVLSTALLNTQELTFLRSAAAMVQGNQTLQSQIASSNDVNSKGLVNTNDLISTQPLTKAIEEMFQNVTISLMSSGALQ